MKRVNAAVRIQQMERAPGNPTRGRLQVTGMRCLAQLRIASGCHTKGKFNVMPERRLPPPRSRSTVPTTRGASSPASAPPAALSLTPVPRA